MTLWTPTWSIDIDGVEYKDVTLSNLNIGSGRTDIYSQAIAGYCNLTIIDLDDSPIIATINSAVTVYINNSSGTPVAIFGGGRANGGPVNAGTSYVVGERGPELFVPNTSGKIIPNGGSGGGGSTINVTVNGAIDAEGTARTIVDVLNRSFSRGTLGALNFQS